MSQTKLTSALRPLSPTYFHKILELLLTYLVSLSQPHNAPSVLELSRSLEFEHEVRREVTLHVMRWFGQVDDADERWEMVIEKVVVKSAWVFCNDPISEDEFVTMEYRRRRYLHFEYIPQPTYNLFLTRELWEAEHIKPYLSDIAVDPKDLDKLLLKYARALTDKDGSWYTVRAR
ncbi:hypothetical protein BGY98DRAFT_1179784 [Russula aff. rugulosa BPL654]|nr:hypothetical protein BGY98DRAFT_1179784 [Russula aff. rugulosa BPL654]